MHTAIKEKLFGGAGTAVIVGALGYALVLGFDVRVGQRVQEVVTMLDLRAPPPPKPVEKRIVHPTLSKPSGKASPAHLRNKAAEVALPKPVIIAPPPPPTVIAAPLPSTWMAASSGASNHAGPGQGAGGVGNGTGSGGAGNGEGGGDIAPRKTKGYLTYSDIPATLRQTDFDVTVWVRYAVEADGRVDDCRVTTSSGRSEIDAITCQLIQQRFRYKPSKMANGTPVRSIVVEKHEWVNQVEQEKARG